MKTLNINLFGGPGSSKSTTAAGLFHQMKINHQKVELSNEYAKDLTYGEDYIKLQDQIHLLGEQHHRQYRLEDKVDYIIHDSPFLQGCCYIDEKANYTEEFIALAIKLHKNYYNLNVFLIRDNDAHPYQEYGRNQKLHEAEDKDRQIKAILDDNNIHYIEAKIGPDLVHFLLLEIEKRNK